MYQEKSGSHGSDRKKLEVSPSKIFGEPSRDFCLDVIIQDVEDHSLCICPSIVILITIGPNVPENFFFFFFFSLNGPGLPDFFLIQHTKNGEKIYQITTKLPKCP
jgi:hypothetical protein